MATSDSLHTAGIMPSWNTAAALVAICGVYITRFGTIAEGREVGLLLAVTTDFLIPIAAVVWILLVPAYTLYCRARE